MAKMARQDVFSPNEIACVHVMNRAVRRCFLLGDDPISGKNFDHRKRWMESKLELHAANFGIDLLGYAILSNHFHLLLRSRPDVVASWSDNEIARRWWMLCPKRKKADGSAEKPNPAEIKSITGDPAKVEEVRSRLSDISWWMRLLCQHVGQRANRETGEEGKFWQDRFRAVRLLDESAMLACVAYVDLNPIRAELAETIEQSDFTSAQKRLEALLLQTVSAKIDQGNCVTPPDHCLAPVHCDERSAELGTCVSRGGSRCSEKGFLNMTAADYLQLLDWTAREVASGKSGTTPADAPTLLERVGLKPASWLALVRDFGRLFHHVAGQPHQIASTKSRHSKRRFRVRSKVLQAFAAA